VTKEQAKKMQENLSALGAQIVVRFPNEETMEYRLELTPQETGIDAARSTRKTAAAIFGELFGAQALNEDDIVCKPRAQSIKYTRNV
jgi:hypothetical protein